MSDERKSTYSEQLIEVEQIRELIRLAQASPALPPLKIEALLEICERMLKLIDEML